MGCARGGGGGARSRHTLACPLPHPGCRYAMEAISNAGSCVGILAKDGVVLAAEKRITSKVAALASRAAWQHMAHARETRPWIRLCWCSGRELAAHHPAPAQPPAFTSPAASRPCALPPAAAAGHAGCGGAAGEDVSAGRSHRVRGGGHHRRRKHPGQHVPPAGSATPLHLPGVHAHRVCAPLRVAGEPH